MFIGSRRGVVSHGAPNGAAAAHGLGVRGAANCDAAPPATHGPRVDVVVGGTSDSYSCSRGRTAGVDGVGGGSGEGRRDGARRIATVLGGRRVGNCTSGGTAEGVDVGLHAHSDVGLVSLRVLGVLVVGDWLGFHVLWCRDLKVTVIVHERVRVDGRVGTFQTRGAVVRPHYWKIAHICFAIVSSGHRNCVCVLTGKQSTIIPRAICTYSIEQDTTPHREASRRVSLVE